MPKAVKPKKLPALHEKVLQQYIKEGATPEKIPAVAKRYRMKPGAVTKILRLKRVEAALKERLTPVQLEQQRQQMVGDAVAEVTERLERENQQYKEQVENIKKVSKIRVTGNEELLEQRLMQLVLGLDMKKCPGTILDAIKTSFVVAGVMRQGNTERVLAPDSPNPGGVGVYQNVFERERAALTAGAPAKDGKTIDAVKGADGVFDLMPGGAPAPVPTTAAEIVLPKAGESIEPEKKKAPAGKPTQKEAASVMTVEIG